MTSENYKYTITITPQAGQPSASYDYECTELEALEYAKELRRALVKGGGGSVVLTSEGEEILAYADHAQNGNGGFWFGPLSDYYSEELAS